MSGPTNAIQPSPLALSKSPPICEMPPKMNSVMRVTGSPRMRATTECASSCASTLPKKRSAVRIPSATRSPVASPDERSGPTSLLSIHATSTKMNNQLRSM